MEYKYIVYSYDKGRCVDHRYCTNIEQVISFQAVCRSKNHETEIIGPINETKPEKKNVADVHVPLKDDRKGWKRPVQCVETKKIFSSIKECSRCLKISHKSIWNAINSKRPRMGLHFINYTGTLPPSKKTDIKKNINGKKVVCKTTGQIFKSVKETLLAFPNINSHKLYKALRQKQQIVGFSFEYL